MHALDILENLLRTIPFAFGVPMVVLSLPYRNILGLFKLYVKPFSCPLCATFWAYLFTSIFYFDVNVGFSILFAGVAGFLADQVSKVLETY